MCPSVTLLWIGRPVPRSRASVTSLPDVLSRSWRHAPCLNHYTVWSSLWKDVVGDFFDSSPAFMVHFHCFRLSLVSASRGRSLTTCGGARVWIMLLIWGLLWYQLRHGASETVASFSSCGPSVFLISPQCTLHTQLPVPRRAVSVGSSAWRVLSR